MADIAEVKQEPGYASSYTPINNQLGGPAAQVSFSVFSEEFAEPNKITETCEKFMAYANDHNNELLGIKGLDKDSRLTSMEVIPGESTDMLVTIKAMDSNGGLREGERYSKVPVTDVINLAKEYDREGPVPDQARDKSSKGKGMNNGPEQSGGVALEIS